MAHDLLIFRLGCNFFVTTWSSVVKQKSFVEKWSHKPIVPMYCSWYHSIVLVPSHRTHHRPMPRPFVPVIAPMMVPPPAPYNPSMSKKCLTPILKQYKLYILSTASQKRTGLTNVCVLTCLLPLACPFPSCSYLSNKVLFHANQSVQKYKSDLAILALSAITKKSSTFHFKSINLHPEISMAFSDLRSGLNGKAGKAACSSARSSEDR